MPISRQLACPEDCWHSAILFQRLTIFNLKSHERPLKKPLDSIECDQIGYHNLSVYSKDLCKVDYTEILRTLIWLKWIMLYTCTNTSISRMKKAASRKLSIRLQYLNSLGFMTDCEKQDRLWILTTKSVSRYISTASQIQGSQRRDMLFTLAVNPTETATHYSVSTASGKGE